MKVIIFGIGNYYKNRRAELESYASIEITALTDNNSVLWGTNLDGIQVIPPKEIHRLPYDIIIVMSSYWAEIREQLSILNIEDTKIKSWERFRSEILCGKIEIFGAMPVKQDNNKNVLIVSPPLNYSGAPLAAVYAAEAIKDRGISVVLAAGRGDKNFIEETVHRGITVAICSAFPYIYDEERQWIQKFDVVIVNVFPMVQCAYDISLFRPTLWWIHEAKMFYDPTIALFNDCIKVENFKNINILAVSKIAMENFNAFFPNRVSKILHYGIPDLSLRESVKVKEKGKLVFAIIGNICERKAQDIFVDAVKHLNSNRQAEFWIIGQMDSSKFCENIKLLCEEVSSIRLFGALTRKEMYDIFPQIDVVVCVSREDPLPITMTEGMMLGKVCITTTGTGTIDFIQDGENGFVIPIGDAQALQKKIKWIIDNKKKLKVIGRNARKTYEKFFSMGVFGRNLERALEETEVCWNGRVICHEKEDFQNCYMGIRQNL